MHLAHANAAVMISDYEDPLMADFVAQLDPVNATADSSPGFVWRLADDDVDEEATRSPFVLWWIESGHLPTIAEAKTRFDLLWADGPSPVAFTFATRFSPEEVIQC
jgi:uncharacterized protein DUF3291